MLSHLFQALYPKQCFVCKVPILDQGVLCCGCSSDSIRVFNYCQQCGGEVSVGSLCPSCDLNDHLNVMRHYIIGYHYQNAMREAIIQLKFNHKMHMVRVIKALMHPVLDECSDALSSVDYIVPMPVDRVRLAGRGFNHMLEIAQSLQSIIDKPIRRDILHKRAFSIPQSNLSKHERATNLHGAFECSQITGHVLLIDDVLTTGKTLQFAMDALINAGVTEITVLVLAKA